jgi:hypothetical protein
MTTPTKLDELKKAAAKNDPILVIRQDSESVASESISIETTPEVKQHSQGKSTYLITPVDEQKGDI